MPEKIYRVRCKIQPDLGEDEDELEFSESMKNLLSKARGKVDMVPRTVIYETVATSDIEAKRNCVDYYAGFGIKVVDIIGVN